MCRLLMKRTLIQMKILMKKLRSQNRQQKVVNPRKARTKIVKAKVRTKNKAKVRRKRSLTIERKTKMTIMKSSVRRRHLTPAKSPVKVKKSQPKQELKKRNEKAKKAKGR